GVLSPARRYQCRGAGRGNEQCRLEHDDRGEAPGVDDLPTKERTDDEDCGAGSPYPAVLESRVGIARPRSAERECIGQRRGGRERRSMEEADQQERREGWRRQQAKRNERG